MEIHYHIKTILEQNKKFCKDGKLFKNVIIEAGLKLDTELLTILINDDIAKKYFFTKVNETLIFDKIKFQKFISNKQFLPDSYTAYKNKIGLTAEGAYLTEANEVVLDFPYKDCVLEGGQTKEDQKRNEIFYNEVLAPDEIDKLFDTKVLTNFKRFSKEGEQKTQEIKRDEGGTIKENLIIKGNNLLALHSLKKQFAGKIKLIYIDPPYNTGNDGFKYNDNFNHSTWLVFMKNRLEIAKQLLKDDGVIFVQCDDNEQAYLKVLMDEVFGRENFISTSIVVINRGGRDYGGIAKTHEYLTIYSKNQFQELNFIEEKNKKFDYQDELGGFNLMELRNRNILFNDKNRPNLCYPFYVNPKNKDENSLLEISLENKEGFIKIMPLKSQNVQTVWRWGKEKVLDNINIDIKAKEKKDGSYMIVQKYRKSTKRQRSIWDDKEFVNERGTEHIKKLFEKKSFAYPKSEFLLQRIIEIATQPDDIVLDYHLGSGTTAAVAHKMGRQYIGIEQMDYIETIAVERLKKVIAGEQGGISKSVHWKGGGDFIYCELAKWNEQAKEQILKCENLQELESFFDDNKDRYFLKYNLNFKKFKKVLKDDDNFKKLSLEEQKQLFMATLDNNQMYVNKSEIEDTDYKISDVDKELNLKFYK